MVRVGCALALMTFVAVLPIEARAQSEQQALVDRSTLAAQELLNDHDGHDAQSFLKRARAAMICPQVFRGRYLRASGAGWRWILVVSGVLQHGLRKLRISSWAARQRNYDDDPNRARAESHYG